MLSASHFLPPVPFYSIVSLTSILIAKEWRSCGIFCCSDLSSDFHFPFLTPEEIFHDPRCGALFLELGRQVIPALYPAILSTSGL